MVPGKGEDVLQVFVYSSPVGQKILIYDVLTVLEMCRTLRPKDMEDHVCVVDFLLRNGSRFAILAETIRYFSQSKAGFLTFPVRPEGWEATIEDYRNYMSWLKIFLDQRPHVVVAALARGGIAWRLVRHVLGLQIDLVLDCPVFAEQSESAVVGGISYWYQEPDEGEWFFLVGGYQYLTGLSVLLYNQITLTIPQAKDTKQGISLGGPR